MLLREVTERASVEFFLRTLSFRFPGRDIVGLPGDLIGLEQPHDEEDIVLFIHELEHLSQLTYPVGVLFTALGLRADDLRKRMYQRFREMLSSERRLEPEDLELASDVVLLASQMVEFVQLVFITTELLTPLLEGLALLAELELDFTDREDTIWSHQTAIAIEYHHKVNLLALADIALLKRLDDAQERYSFVSTLEDALGRQIEHARSLRRRGSLIDRVFLHERNDERSTGAAPYFYGYLLLRRLHQQWRRQLPKMEAEDFFFIATRVICSLVPISVVGSFSLKQHAGRAFSSIAPELLKSLLQDLLFLNKAEIEYIRDSDELLVWSWEDRRPVPFPEIPTGAEGADAAAAQYAAIVSSIAKGVFDVENPEDEDAQAILRTIILVEKCKFLVPAGESNVVVVGVNEENSIVLLVDEARRVSGDGGQVGYTVAGATFFQFREGLLSEFLRRFETPQAPVPRISFHEVPYRLSSIPDPIRGKLITFWYFWPFGVPYVAQGVLAGQALPVAPVRLLVLEQGGTQFAFLSGLDDPQLPELLKTRGVMNKTLMRSIKAALAPNFEDALSVLEQICSLYPRSSLPGLGADLMLKQNRAKTFAKVQSTCRQIYCDLLFTMAGEPLAEPHVSERKFEIVRDTLDAEDRKRLRNWLHSGLVLNPKGYYDPSEAPEDMESIASAVDRVRQSAVSTIRVPLVAWNSVPPRITLDLIPPEIESADE